MQVNPEAVVALDPAARGRRAARCPARRSRRTARAGRSGRRSWTASPGRRARGGPFEPSRALARPSGGRGAARSSGRRACAPAVGAGRRSRRAARRRRSRARRSPPPRAAPAPSGSSGSGKPSSYGVRLRLWKSWTSWMTGIRPPVSSSASTVSESGRLWLWITSGRNSASAVRSAAAGRSVQLPPAVEELVAAAVQG